MVAEDGLYFLNRCELGSCLRFTGFEAGKAVHNLTYRTCLHCHFFICYCPCLCGLEFNVCIGFKSLFISFCLVSFRVFELGRKRSPFMTSPFNIQNNLINNASHAGNSHCVSFVSLIYNFIFFVDLGICCWYRLQNFLPSPGCSLSLAICVFII